MTDNMTRLMLTAIVAAAVLAMGVNSATALSLGNSATWEGSYEADSLPGSVGWTGGLDTGSINSGILSYSGTDNTTNYNLANIDAGTNGGVSFEFRMRLNAGGFFMHLFTTSATNYRWGTVEISTSQVGIGDSGTGTATVGVDATQYHTYGITSDDTNWYLYMDGVSVAVIDTPVIGAYGVAATDGFQWGGNGSGDFDFDYLRWTDNGGTLFPEPTTLVLLGAGGLLTVARRRRR